jgi:predicted RNA-binding protein with PIN domain
MRYLIDGYNLAHAMGLLRGRVAPAAVEVARRSLLVHLLEYHHREPGNVTVVFDASRAPPGTADRLDYQGIHVLNALHEQADDLIEDLIHREPQPRQLTVVSDDRRLKDAARHRQCVALGCFDYLEKVQYAPPQVPLVKRPAEGNDKPPELSAEEVQEWCRQFGVTEEPEDRPGW